MGELDVRLLLRLLREDTEPDPMPESLLEMFREWCRLRGVVPFSESPPAGTGPASRGSLRAAARVTNLTNPRRRRTGLSPRR